MSVIICQARCLPKLLLRWWIFSTSNTIFLLLWRLCWWYHWIVDLQRFIWSVLFIFFIGLELIHLSALFFVIVSSRFCVLVFYILKLFCDTHLLIDFSLLILRAFIFIVCIHWFFCMFLLCSRIFRRFFYVPVYSGAILILRKCFDLFVSCLVRKSFSVLGGNSGDLDDIINDLCALEAELTDAQKEFSNKQPVSDGDSGNVDDLYSTNKPCVSIRCRKYPWLTRKSWRRRRIM